MKTQVGIIGTGRMAVRLARMLLDNGHQVVLGSSTATRARNLARILGREKCIPGSYEEAAAQPVVMPAIFVRDGLFEVMDRLRERVAGKIMIDIANPFTG